MSDNLKLVVDIKKEVKNTGTDTEKAIFNSLKKITTSSFEEYIGSATFSMVVDAIQFKTNIFSINQSFIGDKEENGVLAKPKTDL